MYTLPLSDCLLHANVNPVMPRVVMSLGTIVLMLTQPLNIMNKDQKLAKCIVINEFYVGTFSVHIYLCQIPYMCNVTIIAFGTPSMKENGYVYTVACG